MRPNLIAMDSSSVRRYDGNGHLLIDRTVITKAGVDEYLGKEIPGFEQLGLHPTKIYRLLRDPEELSKALFTFKGVQFLLRHIPVSAEKPQKDSTAGAIGTDIEMVDGTVYSSMRVWCAKAIRFIESEKLKELSAGYAYTPDMTPGEWEGQPYDGVMRDIHGNHVALVKHGRIGTDAVIADHLPDELRERQMGKKTKLKKGAVARIAAVIRGFAMDSENPELGQDEVEEVVKAVAEEIEEPEKVTLGADEVKDGLAALDEDVVKEILTELGVVPTAEDGGDDLPPPAMDSAEILNTAKKEARREMMDLFTAREEVKPLVGVIAMDSALDTAESVYKHALDTKGVDTAGVPPSAYKAMVGLLKSNTASQQATRPRIAMDSDAAIQTAKHVGRFG